MRCARRWRPRARSNDRLWGQSCKSLDGRERLRRRLTALTPKSLTPTSLHVGRSTYSSDPKVTLTPRSLQRRLLQQRAAVDRIHGDVLELAFARDRERHAGAGRAAPPHAAIEIREPA